MQPVRRVLSTLAEADRRTLHADLAALTRDEAWGDRATWWVARALRFREATVRRAEPEQRIRLVAKALGRMDDRALTDLFVALHGCRRFATWRDVAALAGIDVADGAESDEQALDAQRAAVADDEEPSGAEGGPRLDDDTPEERVRMAVGRLHRRFGVPAVRLAAATLVALGPAGDDPVRRALDRILAVEESAARDTGAASAIAGHDEVASAHEAEEPTGLEAPDFTTLDQVLIRATVSSLNDVVGSLDSDHLDDLVQELIELNDSRAQSWFHRGFLDALLERPLAASAAGDNAERRAWRVVGHHVGLLRRRTVAEVLEELERLQPADRELLLGRSAPACGSMLAAEIVLPLVERGDTARAHAWIERHGARLPGHVVARLGEWARKALVGGAPAEVRRVLEAVLASRAEAERDPLPTPLRRTLERRLAIALRCEGRADLAEARVDRLLEDCEDRAELARLLGDKALIALGIQRVESLALGPPATRRTLLEAIERTRPLLERAVGEGNPPSVPALVALALPVVAQQGEGPGLAPARSLLRRALDGMTGEDGDFWQKTGLWGRVRLYLSLLELRGSEASLWPAALARLAELLEHGEPMQPDLLEEAIIEAATKDVHGTAGVARHALAAHPELILRSTDLAALARRSRPFRAAALAALEETGARLTGQERWRACVDLLQGSLAAPERDLEAARTCLDALEVMAHEDRGSASRFLRLLDGEASWDPAWTHDDALSARARLHEHLGRIADARVSLRELAHSAITHQQVTFAEDLVDRLVALGADAAEVDDIRLRLRAEAEKRTPPEAPARPARPVHVVLVGGNEVQRAYEEQLRRWFAAEWPGSRLDLELTSWSSNWGRQLEAMSERLAQADALVILRFVRTELGRRLRRIASEHDIPWIACTGHGHDSLQRAIAQAARVASGTRATG